MRKACQAPIFALLCWRRIIDVMKSFIRNWVFLRDIYWPSEINDRITGCSKCFLSIFIVIF